MVFQVTVRKSLTLLPRACKERGCDASFPLRWLAQFFYNLILCGVYSPRIANGVWLQYWNRWLPCGTVFRNRAHPVDEILPTCEDTTHILVSVEAALGKGEPSL